MKISLFFGSKPKSDEFKDYDPDQLIQYIRERLTGGVFNRGQKIIIKNIFTKERINENNVFYMRIDELIEVESKKTTINKFLKLSDEPKYFFISDRTEFFHSGQALGSQLGIKKFTIPVGGLEKQLDEIARKVFTSRFMKPEYFSRLGIQHVKGVLLYGPPGCGKTRAAVELCNLSGFEHKIVNSPEIFGKYVGESEERIRALFAPARANPNKTWAIIFDEFDSISKKRGSTGDGTSASVSENIVNQLLSETDGAERLNNIILIACTNRKDLIDEAILRPGRFEVHVEIGLPDLNGRKEIFKIHTAKLFEEGFLDEDCDFTKLAILTENFTGAEIESVVKNTAMSVVYNKIDKENLAESARKLNISEYKITQQNFLHAINELEPMFANGKKKNYLIWQLIKPIWQFNSWIHTKILNESLNTTHNANEGGHTESKKYLIYGEPQTGKTSLALKIAHDLESKYFSIIRPRDLLDYDERGRKNYLVEKFQSHTGSGLIVIDDIDLLIEFVRGHYLNVKTVLTLKILIKESTHTLILTTNNYEYI
jgi:vesicle-fusing ATPase